MTREEKAIRNEQMKVYKAEGHTNKEVAEKFSVSVGYCYNICKGIARQHSTVNLQNQYTAGTYDRIENCKRIIARYHPELEYVGNFKDVDSPVDVRCKTCGYVFSRSMVTFRKPDKKINCPACEEARKQKEKELQEQAKEKARLEKEETRRIAKVKRAKSTQLNMKVCECCGALFVADSKKKYCSDVCSKRVLNAIHKDRRLKKIKSQIVDRGITLERLIERDKCKCAICGRLCNTNDYYYKGNTFIAGDYYPSIDHIIPLSLGGEHSWNNIQLAHRICNTRKSNKIYPPISSNARSEHTTGGELQKTSPSYCVFLENKRKKDRVNGKNCQSARSYPE